MIDAARAAFELLGKQRFPNDEVVYHLLESPDGRINTIMTSTNYVMRVIDPYRMARNDADMLNLIDASYRVDLIQLVVQLEDVAAKIRAVL